MNLLALFAVLLMVTQAPVPVPRQTPNINTYKSKTQNQGADTNQNPRARLISSQAKKSHSPAFKPNTNENPTIYNPAAINITNPAPMPVAWGWHERAIFWANLALAIVGIAGIVVAICTLCFIKRQAIEMRLQRIVMRRTLIAISRQANDMERQTGILEKSVATAQSGVESNELQIELAERPWVSAKVYINGPLTVRPEGVYVHVLIEMKNYGHTPAIGVYIDPLVHVLKVSKPHPFQALKKQCEESLTRENTGGEIIFPGSIFTESYSIQVPNEQIVDGYVGGNPIYSMALTVCVSYRTTFKAAARYYTGINYDLWKHNPDAPGRFVFRDGEEVPKENFRAALSSLIGTVAK